MSKSKLMKFSIPPNEMCALALGLELVYAAILSISHPIESVILNQNTPHKVFIQNCVLTVNRYIQWISERLQNGSVTLAHIPGQENIADILTKLHPRISSLDQNSLWQCGQQWMRMDMKDMPLTYFEDLTLTNADFKKISEEAHLVEIQSHLPEVSNPTVFLSPSLDESGMEYILSPNETVFMFKKIDPVMSCISNPLIDVIHVGWTKSNHILQTVAMFCGKLFHQTHLNTKNATVSLSISKRCAVCTILKTMNTPNTKTCTTEITLSVDSQLPQALITLADTVVNHYWDYLATQDCLACLAKKDLDCCTLNPDTGILFYK